MQAQLRKLVGSIRSTPVVAHAAAYAASEASAKISRLLVVVAMARFMSPAEIGIAAAALALGEIIKSLTENGVIHMVIRARADDLEATAKTARGVAWAWCCGLALIQAALAGALYGAGFDAMLALLLALLGLEYVLMPGGLVQCALAMREGRLRQTAMISGTVNVTSNVLTALLVTLVPSPLSVVAGKLIPAPIWLVAMRRVRPWRAVAARGIGVRPFVVFGRAVIGIEFVKTVRLQADKLIIGGLMGADALGVYFFAVNAGLGLATSFSTAVGTVLFPHLCNAERQDRAFVHALALCAGLIAPVVIAQSLLAPIYVPLVFGAQWAEIAPLVGLLCLAAIPAVVWAGTSQFLRARGEVSLELRLTLAIATASLGATALAAPFGLFAVAVAILATSVVVQIGLSLPFIVRALVPSRALTPASA